MKICWMSCFLSEMTRGGADNAEMRLQQLDSAQRLDDLRQPPSNRLEALKGDRRGRHSIRINDQWRLCFKFAGGKASDVEIVDYHR